MAGQAVPIVPSEHKNPSMRGHEPDTKGDSDEWSIESRQGGEWCGNDLGLTDSRVGQFITSAMAKEAQREAA